MNTFRVRDIRPAITTSRAIGLRPISAGDVAPNQSVRQAVTSPFSGVAVQQLFLSGLITPSWRVREPFSLALERDEYGQFLVSDAIFAMYGVGNTEQEALQDYIASLIEYYDILAQHTDEPTQLLFHDLQHYIEPAHT